MFPILVRYLRPLFCDDRGNCLLTPLFEEIPDMAAAVLSVSDEPFTAEQFWLTIREINRNETARPDLLIAIMAPLHPERLANLRERQDLLQKAVTELLAGFLFIGIDCSITIMLCPAVSSSFFMEPDNTLED